MGFNLRNFFRIHIFAKLKAKKRAYSETDLSSSYYFSVRYMSFYFL